ncbi:MAG: DUF418 domain-containing protein [Pseudomonadota bacterium]
MAQTLITPVQLAQRIDLLDVIRGIAVCGILAVNIFVMGTLGSTQGRNFPLQWDANWIAWVGQRLFLEGPMRGLFMILFGAGMVMMLRRSEGESPRVAPIDIWARRSLALLGLGVVHFLVLMWPGEILWTLGVAAFPLLAFRVARPPTLWIWALVIIACLSAHRAYSTSGYLDSYQAALAGERARADGRLLTPEQEAGLAVAAGAASANHPTEEALDAEYRQRTTLGPLIKWSAAGWAFRHLEIYSWIGVAESLAFMLVGMALFRSRILTGEAPRHIYWWMLLAGGGVGLGLRLVDLWWQARTGFELDIYRLNPAMSLLRSASYQPARLALTLAYVGLFALVWRSGLRAWAVPFRAMGRTALTVYTLQSFLTSILFYALGYVGAFGAASLLVVSLGLCVVTAAFSMLWLKHRSIGPMEWLLRAIAYGRLNPTREPAAPRRR